MVALSEVRWVAPICDSWATLIPKSSQPGWMALVEGEDLRQLLFPS